MTYLSCMNSIKSINPTKIRHMVELVPIATKTITVTFINGYKTCEFHFTGIFRVHILAIFMIISIEIIYNIVINW